MKLIKDGKDVCPYCAGRGWISSRVTGTMLGGPCPACSGDPESIPLPHPCGPIDRVKYPEHRTIGGVEKRDGGGEFFVRVFYWAEVEDHPADTCQPARNFTIYHTADYCQLLTGPDAGKVVLLEDLTPTLWMPGESIVVHREMVVQWIDSELTEADANDAE